MEPRCFDHRRPHWDRTCHRLPSLEKARASSFPVVATNRDKRWRLNYALSARRLNTCAQMCGTRKTCGPRSTRPSSALVDWMWR
jgi:hypothetical protein